MAKFKIKKGDVVMVIAGKDKGKSGEIKQVDTANSRVVVEGVNIVSKCHKPRTAQEKGGILKQEAAIAVSNVMILCPSCGKTTRVAYKVDQVEKDGKMIADKVRVCKHCSASLDVSASKKKAAVKKTAKVDKAEKKTRKKENKKDDSQE